MDLSGNACSATEIDLQLGGLLASNAAAAGSLAATASNSPSPVRPSGGQDWLDSAKGAAGLASNPVPARAAGLTGDQAASNSGSAPAYQAPKSAAPFAQDGRPAYSLNSSPQSATTSAAYAPGHAAAHESDSYTRGLAAHESDRMAPSSAEMQLRSQRTMTEVEQVSVLPCFRVGLP